MSVERVGGGGFKYVCLFANVGLQGCFVGLCLLLGFLAGRM